MQSHFSLHFIYLFLYLHVQSHNVISYLPYKSYSFKNHHESFQMTSYYKEEIQKIFVDTWLKCLLYTSNFDRLILILIAPVMNLRTTFLNKYFMVNLCFYYDFYHCLDRAKQEIW